ncbi:hypothetical protein [Synechococcus sp. Minos11]|uniref:hypothetical protein n=1 Tax=Synechococcus sp. Minos11 TaxID=221341 RepID=UPI0016465756|nr:hypothetical protein [Synechococcus sp. Minos11]
MQKIAGGVMAQLKPQQPGFAIDAEIKFKVFVEFVVQLGALANARNPVLEKLHIGIRAKSRTKRRLSLTINKRSSHQHHQDLRQLSEAPTAKM